MTNYIVCLKTGSETLRILGTQESHSGDGAIRKQAGAATGRYVAIPVSNWHEVENDVAPRPPVATLTKVEPVFPGQQKLPEPEPEVEVPDAA